MTTNKRIKSNVEKRYIAQMWVQRSRYNTAKEEFDSIFGTFQDGQMMKKAQKEMNRLRIALSRERSRMAA